MAREKVFIPDPTPSELTIQLERGRAVKGIVLVAGTSIPVPNARVVAWPAEQATRRWTFERSLWAVREDPRATATTAGVDGTFELTGLPPRGRLSMFAGAAGLVSVGAPQDVESLDSPVVLELAPVYVAQLEFRPDQPSCSSGDLEVFRAGSLTVLDKNVVQLPIDIAPLVGLDDPGLTTIHANRLCLLFRRKRLTPDPDVAVGPFTITIECPGFASQDVVFEARRLVGKPVPLAVTLPPVDGTFGGLMLSFEGTAPRRRPEEPAYLLLERAKSIYRICINGPGSAANIGCLPEGDYTVKYQSAPGLAAMTLGTVTIQQEELASFPVNWGLLGGIRLKVSRGSGEPFSGHVPIDIAREEDVSGYVGEFQHIDYWAPNEKGAYVIDGLAPGDYRLLMNGPFSAEDGGLVSSEGWIGPLTVHASECSEVRIQYLGSQ